MFAKATKIITSCILSIFATIFVANFSASALQLSNLETISEPNEAIEQNEPTEGYNFDATLLDHNLELKYRATVTNDEDTDIEITGIDFTNSAYSFLDYSYGGIKIGDKLARGDTREIIIAVKTNDQPTQTIDENLNLSLHYRKVSAPNAPPEDPSKGIDEDSNAPVEEVVPSTPNTLDNIAVVGIILLIAGLATAIILKKNGKLRMGTILLALGLSALAFTNGGAKADSDYTFTILGKIHFVNSYTVTIKPNGGSYNDSTSDTVATYRDGEVLRVTNPTREHYSFTGWTVEPGELTNNTIVISADTTLTANWQEIQYTVTVDPDGGRYANSTEPTITEVREGDEFAIGADPVRDTYHFQGWHVTGGELVNGKITVNSNVYIKALWDENYYDVTVKPNGGSYLGLTSDTTTPHREGESITMQEPTREHYRFTGWTISAGELVNNQFTVTQNVTLTANWEAINHTVTIKPNGGIYNNSTADFKKSYPEGTEITISTPTREHYRFTGWTATPSILGADNKLVVSENVTLTANWEPIYHSLQINPNGGIYKNSTNIEQNSIFDGDSYTFATPTREHYSFAGWSLTAGEIIDGKITVTTDIIATAQWSEIKHTVTVNPNGGNYSGQLQTEVQEGNEFTIGANPTREHYRFTGWTISAGTLSNGKITVTQDITITANWEAIMFTVTVNPNGGNYSGQLQTEVQEGNEFTIGADPTRDTYAFGGWTVDAGELTNGKITVTQDIVITAKWTENYHALTIKPNGGSYNNLTSDTTLQVREGKTENLLQPTRAHYNFDGWDFIGDEPNDNKITITQDTILTAKWSEIRFDVTIDPNGGIYQEHSTSYTDSYQEGSGVAMGTPTREHYTFDGWQLSVGEFDTDNHFTVMQDVTVTAQWSSIEFDLTIDPNGGSYNNHTAAFTDSHLEGDVVDITTPTRTHYRFTGWTISGDAIENGKITITQNTTITATWEPIMFDLTIDPNGGLYDDHDSAFTKPYQEGDVVNLTTPTKTGATFDYWLLEDDSHYDASNIEITRNITLVAQYKDNYYDLTIDPNGGKFNNSTEIYSKRVKYGDVINLTNTEYENHEIRNWTKNETETLDAGITEITITDDTDLRINWWSSIKYTVTIAPNLGTYLGSTETQQFQIRKDEPFTFEDVTREGYVLTFWQLDDAAETRLGENASFTVTHDVTATANWALAVARIERTQKIYTSIMAAEAEAQTNDIITLLVDTAEIVTNEKKVTLDLNNHTVTGYILNTADGDLTLINGEINNYTSPSTGTANPNGAAVINNGTLTMGVNDYTSDGTVNIVNNNIRLIGTETGLDQNNKFYFYDGFIEGVIGLNGGYDGSPFYRDTYENKTIYYFPFVTHNEQKDCQHVELTGADRAVSKTTIHGDIYYYNLQDNINTSIRTGYPIYAVRNFDASYPITIPVDAEIVFDVAGYTVQAGDDWINSGTLNITNSKQSEETGALNVARTIINDGTLNFSDITVSALSANPVINNHSHTTLANTTLSSEYGYVLEVTEANTTLEMDDNSYIKTNTRDIIPIHNTSTNFIINGGHVYAPRTAILNEGRTAKITINGGEIKAEAPTTNTDIYSQTTIKNNLGTIIINGGEVKAVALNSSSSAISNVGSGGAIEINGGTISITQDERRPQSYSISAVESNNSTLTLNGGTVTATGVNDIRGIASNSTIVMTGGNIVVNSTSTTGNSDTSGIYFTTNGNFTMSGGNITTTTKRNNAYGIKGRSNSYSTTINMTDGNISAIAEDSSAISTGVYLGIGTIAGGDIYGKTYGVRIGAETESVNIGTNDFDDNGQSIISTKNPNISGDLYAIHGGNIHFFDGILQSENNPYLASSMREIPSDAKIACSSDNKQCWLEHAANYLEVDGQPFNSLELAYRAAKNSTNLPKTITVTGDYSTSASNPTIEKGQDITLNLNGHTIEYYQPIRNQGTLTITDSDAGTGKLVNLNHLNTPIIINSNIFNLDGGTITARRTAIQSTIESSNINNSPAINLNSGAVSVIGDADSAATGNIEAISCNNGNSNQVFINSGASVIAKAAPSATNQTAYGVYNCRTTIDGGTIEATANSSVAGIYSGYLTKLIDGSIVVNGKDGTTSGIWYPTNVEMNGGTITVNSTNSSAHGIYVNNAVVTMTGGTIDVHNGSYAYGIRTNSGTSNRGTLNLSGGTITAISTNQVGSGVKSGINNITGGVVTGSTYGIENENDSNPTTLGKDDGTISNGTNASPMITGGTYGIYRGYVYFYDGVIRGPQTNDGTISAYTTDAIKAIPRATNFHYEDIDNRQNCWLKASDPYLMVNGDTYASLDEAYEHANDGDTIYVIANYTTQSNLPENPAGKSITIDLQDFTLSYYQPLVNRGDLTIIAKGEHGAGRLVNVNPAATNTVTNYGTLNIKSGEISSSYVTVENRGTLNISGGKIITDVTGTNSTNHVALYNYGSANIIEDTEASTHGVIEAISHISNSTTIMGISSGSTSSRLSVIGGEINVLKTDDQGNTAYGVYNITYGEFTNAIVSVKATGYAIGINSNSNDIVITDSTITTEAYRYSKAVMSDNGHITINGDTTIHATSEIDSAYGVIARSSSSSYPAYATINDGVIIAESGSGRGIGAELGAKRDLPSQILGGTITGSTYGVYSESDAMTIEIGSNDDTIVGGVDVKPEIIGGSYGAYRGNIYFYDGVIKGGIDSNYDRNIRRIADNSNIHTVTTDNQVIRYLETEHPVARIGTDRFYGSLKKAIDDAENGNEIVLLEDNYIYDAIVIDRTQSITVETDGFDIISGNQFTINGQFKLQNSSQTDNTNIDYHEQNAMFVVDTIINNNNQINANFEMKNIHFKVAQKGIEANANSTVSITNSEITNTTGDNEITHLINITNANLAINNSTIDAPNGTAINGNYKNNIDITDSHVVSDYSAISLGASQQNINTVRVSNSTIEGNRSDTYSSYSAIQMSNNTNIANSLSIESNSKIIGRLSLSSTSGYMRDSQLISSTNHYHHTPLYIAGSASEFELNNVSITSTPRQNWGLSSTALATIVNNDGAKLNITDTQIIANWHDRTVNGMATALYNTASSTTTANNLSISIDNNTPTSSSRGVPRGIQNLGTMTIENLDIHIQLYGNGDARGIYNQSGSVTLLSGNIDVDSKQDAYGIYIQDGDLTLGTAEPTTSPNYGGEHADVSVTNPNIKAVGINQGIGVYKATGRFIYYDGKITGSTFAIPRNDITTLVEHLYEPTFHTDENGYDSCILTWMLQQPSQPSGN